MLAKKADMSAGYLYQLANRWRGKTASMAMIYALVKADDRLTVADLAAEFTEPVQVQADGAPPPPLAQTAGA